MRITVVGYFGWYGSMAEWVADGWEANGYIVTRLDRNDPAVKFGEEPPNLTIFVDCSEDYSKGLELVESLKVFWAMDTQMPGGIERSVNIARKCDLVFSSNYEQGVKVLEKFGIKSYLLPVTYNQRLVPMRELKKDIDVVMIGNDNSPERRQLWLLLKTYFNCIVGRVEKEADYIDAMSRAKVVVNQPTEPWNNILNNRLFEGMAFGAAVVQKRLTTGLIEKLGFADKTHFVYWPEEDFTGLVEQIRYLLDNDGYRQDLAWKGNDAVQKYSMKEQCLKMETIILSEFYDRL